MTEDETQSHVNDLFEISSHKISRTRVDLCKYLTFNGSLSLSLSVKLATANYPIDFVTDASNPFVHALAALEQARRRSAVLTDLNVWQSLSSAARATLGALPRLELPPGEKTKSLGHLGQVLDFMAASRLDRTSVLWVVGGGVTGDLGGFAAASYLRGIEFVQVPTTLLAMVDSSIGGKTGINLAAGKNLVGAFHHPRQVFIALDSLRTLPPREFAAGMAEVIKYGLLGDAALFARLEKSALTASSADLAEVIRRCCEMKAAIVQADERETAPENGRALLNLGHTFGHAVEQVTGYASYLHGEAVAIGLAAAARLSLRLGDLTAAEVARVDRAVAAHQLPVRLRDPLKLDALLEAMQRDKKVRSGQLRFVVLPRIGAAATRGGIDVGVVESVWRELGAV
jgi:3-dehydroquinate synthase